MTDPVTAAFDNRSRPVFIYYQFSTLSECNDYVIISEMVASNALSRGVFVVAAKRTPFGTFGGSLKAHSPTDLSVRSSSIKIGASLSAL